LKRLSQCFLSSPGVTRFISGVAPLRGKRVLEIGAGTGVLTKALAEKAGFVLAIELDKRLLPELRKNLAGFDNVEQLGDLFSRIWVAPHKLNPILGMRKWLGPACVGRHYDRT